MGALSRTVVCRTVVVTAYLLALAVAGRPGWATGSLAVALVAVWLAPLLVHHGRHPAPESAPAPAVVVSEATAG